MDAPYLSISNKIWIGILVTVAASLVLASNVGRLIYPRAKVRDASPHVAVANAKRRAYWLVHLLEVLYWTQKKDFVAMFDGSTNLDSLSLSNNLTKVGFTDIDIGLPESFHDPWGRPFHLIIEAVGTPGTPDSFYRVRVRSDGPNRKDESGLGDDLNLPPQEVR
jgi:hypothetical protein